jgi:hypothetical protein
MFPKTPKKGKLLLVKVNYYDTHLYSFRVMQNLLYNFLV